MPQIVITQMDLQRIAALAPDDLARLYGFLTERLRHVRQLAEPNDNVLSVRVPPHVAVHVAQLAIRHQTTRSRILREAVSEFVRRNPLQ